jgi:hypothetical protein
MNNTQIDIKLLDSGTSEPGYLYKKAEAKALFLAGYRPKEIGEKLDIPNHETIIGWATREDWYEEREKILGQQTKLRLNEILQSQGKNIKELELIREKAMSPVTSGTLTPTRFSEAVNAYINSLDMERKLKMEALQLSFVNDIAIIIREEVEDRQTLSRIANRLTKLFEQYQNKSIAKEPDAET